MTHIDTAPLIGALITDPANGGHGPRFDAFCGTPVNLEELRLQIRAAVDGAHPT